MIRKLLALLLILVLLVSVPACASYAPDESLISSGRTLEPDENPIASEMPTGHSKDESRYESSSENLITSGTITDNGSNLPWKLYDDGTLVVSSGFINWITGGTHSLSVGPWEAYIDNIHKIVFTGPVTGGESLQAMFLGLWRVTVIEGLDYFDTSNVTNMRDMFNGSSRLTSLNVSGWDTRNVTDMSGMFLETTSLASLNLSGWDTRSVTSMNGMFAAWSGPTTIRELTLGGNFSFVYEIRPDHVDLRPVPYNDDYTGLWQNVGTGTVDDPQGEFVFTSQELMTNYDGALMADTWVWQPRR